MIIRRSFLLLLTMLFSIYGFAVSVQEPTDVFNERNFEFWVGDYNGDGRADLYFKAQPLPIFFPIGNPSLLTNAFPSSSYLLSDVYANPPTEQLTLWEHNDSASNAQKINLQIVFEDFNADGKLDVLFLSNSDSSLSFLLLNQGHLSSNIQILNLEQVVQALENPDFLNNEASHYLQSVVQSLDKQKLRRYVSHIFEKHSDDDSDEFDLSYLNVEPSGSIVPGAIAGASSVSELDGSFSYSMPIAVPEGPSNVTPKLSITYNSAGQAGLMGVGFKIGGLSTISECNLPYEVNGEGGSSYQNLHQYCVDGSLLVLRNNGSLYPESNPGIVFKPVNDGFESESLLYERKHYKQIMSIPDRGDKQWHLSRVEDPFGNGYNVDYISPNGLPLVSKITYNDVSVNFHYVKRPYPKQGVYQGTLMVSDRLLKSIQITVNGSQYRTYEFGYERAQNLESVRLNKVIECGANGTCLQPTTFQYEEQTNITFGFEQQSRSTGGICANGSLRFGRCDSPAGDGKQKPYSSKFDGTGNHGTIQYADANGDGHLDICYRSDYQGVRCQINDGQGNFNEHHNVVANNVWTCLDKYDDQCDNPENYGTIRFIDFNKDGKSDVLYRGDTAGIELIPNIKDSSGKDNFDGSKKLTTFMCARDELCDNANNFYSAQYPDLNADGIPDICYRGDKAGIRCKVSLGIDETRQVPIYSPEFTAVVVSKDVDTLQVTPLLGVDNRILSYPHYQRQICGNDTYDYWDGCEFDSIRFIDFDRDGRDDLVFLSHNGIRIFRSNGTSPPPKLLTGGSHQIFEPYLFSNECQKGSECYNYADTLELSDFNHDGWLDACYESNGQMAYKRIIPKSKPTVTDSHHGGNGGDGNGGPGRSKRSASHNPSLVSVSPLRRYRCASLVEVSGNKADSIDFPVTTDGIITWDHNGNEKPGIIAPRAYADEDPYLPNMGTGTFASHLKARRWVDLDYDGDLDFFVTTNSLREQFFLLENGRIVDQGFLNICNQDVGHCDARTIGSFQFVDINHDMAPDIIYRSKHGILYRYGTATNTYRLNKLTRIENGMGLETSVSYKRFKGEVVSDPVTRTSLPAPSHSRLVVNEVTTNTIGGASKLTYEYGKARRDSQRNKINGFSWVKVVKSVMTPTGTYQPILRTENNYAVDSHYSSGSLLSQKRFALSLNQRFPGAFAQSERMISQTTNQWGLFVDQSILKRTYTRQFFRQDLYRTAILQTKTEDFGWVGTLNNGRLQGSATWGAVSRVEQRSNYNAHRLNRSITRYGTTAQVFQLQGSFGGQPVAFEMASGLRTEKDLINHKEHSIKTENAFYPGARSRLKQTTVTKAYQRLDGSQAKSVKTSAWEYYPNGQMKKEIVEPGHELSSVTEYFYNPQTGQRERVVVQGKGIQKSTTHFEYDDHLRVTKVTNALGHSVSTQYNPVLGLPISVTDTNGLTTQTTYDGFGRVIQTTAPNGTQSFIEYAFSQTELTHSVYKVRTWDSLNNESEVYHAPTGQVIYSKTKTFNDEWVETRTEFDHYSQVKRTQRPRFIGDPNQHWDTIIQRDYLGSVTEAENAAGHRVKTLSTARFVEETNTKNQKKTTVMDMKGNLYRVFDNNRNELQYLYSPDGQLLELKDVAGNHSIKMQYDILGNKTQIDDPDKGRIQYWYNAAGQQVLSEQAGVKICQAFDKLGRTIRRHDDYKGNINQALLGCQGSTAGITTYWTYDTAPMGNKTGKGLLHKVTDSRGYLEEYKYNDFGQVIETKRNLKGKTYVERFQYDRYGRLTTQTYPSGFKVENEYEGSFLTTIKNPDSGKAYWHLEAMNANGQATHQLLGNLYNLSHQYDARTGLLNAVGANINGQNSKGELTSRSVHAMRFTFDPLGNLSQREDLKSHLKETFSYDEMNRLTGSKVFASSNAGIPIATDSISYFENGNIHKKSDAGVYSYGQKNNGCQYTPGPHAISQLVTGQNVRNYCYDARGNMTFDGARQVTYAKAHDKPTRIQTNNGRTSVEFEYGPGRGRYYRKDSEQGRITETYYAGSGYEEVFEQGEIRKKHYIGGHAVEIHTHKPRQPVKIEERYLLKDHLGSIVVVGDADGNVLEHHSYDAWGKKRSLDWRRVSGLTDPSLDAIFDADPLYEYFFGDINNDGRVDLVKKAKARYVLLSFGGVQIPVKAAKAQLNNEVLYGKKQGVGTPEVLTTETDFSRLTPSTLHRSLDNKHLPEGVQAERNETTMRGFTGHEHIESLGLVHMNGRVYDPLLGRFLSADPFVQAPTNSQSPNRYSYVFNNPLSFTDPSGYLAIGGIKIGGVFGQMADQIGFHLAKFDYWAHTDGSKVANIGSTVIVAAICVATAEAGPAPCAAAAGARTTWLSGDIKQGVKAAAIAFVSASVAEGIGDMGLSTTQAALAHGFSQGVIGIAGAGRFTWQSFGASFASAAAGHAMGQFVDNKYQDIFLAGSLGGVTSKLAGGSFSDGFMTAAMVRTFNHWEHIKIDLLNAVEAVTKFGMGIANGISFGASAEIGELAYGEDYSKYTEGGAYTAGELASSLIPAKAAQTAVKAGIKGVGSGAANVNAKAALRAKLSGLENAQKTAVKVRQLPDGRVRYYTKEIPARKEGLTRGASFATEYNPKTGQTRQWYESYNHAGQVNRVHPKSINGQTVNSQHYPPTAKELGL